MFVTPRISGQKLRFLVRKMLFMWIYSYVGRHFASVNHSGQSERYMRIRIIYIDYMLNRPFICNLFRKSIFVSLKHVAKMELC